MKKKQRNKQRNRDPIDEAVQSEDAQLFYILVVEMGISPSEVRDLTYIQVESLLYWFEKAQKRRDKANGNRKG